MRDEIVCIIVMVSKFNHVCTRAIRNEAEWKRFLTWCELDGKNWKWYVRTIF